MNGAPWADLAGRVTHLVRQTILSTILPGSVVLIELWVVAGQPELRRALPGLDDLPLVLRGGLALYFAYVIGFTARHLAFVFADLRLVQWRRSRAADETATRPAPYRIAANSTSLHGQAAFAHNVGVLRATFGDTRVDDVLRSHGLGEAVAGSAGVSYDEVFQYAKSWLRARSPRLGVDWLEEEANTLLTAVLPVLLVPVALARLGVAAPWIAVAVVVAAAVVLVLFDRSAELRHAEDFIALRNLIFAAQIGDEAKEPDGAQ